MRGLNLKKNQDKKIKELVDQDEDFYDIVNINQKKRLTR